MAKKKKSRMSALTDFHEENKQNRASNSMIGGHPKRDEIIYDLAVFVWMNENTNKRMATGKMAAWLNKEYGIKYVPDSMHNVLKRWRSEIEERFPEVEADFEANSGS